MKEIHELTETSIINNNDYLCIDTGTATYKIKKSILLPYITQPITQAEYDRLANPDDNTIYFIRG